LILEQNREAQKHPITEKLRHTSSRLNNCPSELHGKNVDGKWRFVVKVPNHNHRVYPPELYPMHQCLDDTGHCCGHCVVRGMGHNSRRVQNYGNP